MDEKPITWADRVSNLAKALGRVPTTEELLDAAFIHQMTPEEREEQERGFAQAMKPTGDPRFD